MVEPPTRKLTVVETEAGNLHTVEARAEPKCLIVSFPNNLSKDPDHRNTNQMKVYVVGGPAGTGKTTIGERLAAALHCPFVEGDSLHPQANIDKMGAGHPLTDDDRWGWLEQVLKVSTTSASESPNHTSVVLCSILKRSYRDLIRKTLPDTEFEMVFLYCLYDELVKRVEGRQGHFMKLDMVKSQYDIMEVPTADEAQSLPVDTTGKLPDDIMAEITAALRINQA